MQVSQANIQRALMQCNIKMKLASVSPGKKEQHPGRKWC
jgi:hypothetical protein